MYSKQPELQLNTDWVHWFRSLIVMEFAIRVFWFEKILRKKLKHLPKQLIGKSKVFDALTSKKIRVDTKPERDKFGVTIIPISESGWKLHLPRPQRRGGYILWKSEEYKHLFSIGMKNKSGISTQEIESAEQLYEILTILEDIGVSTFYSSKAGTAIS